MLDRKLFNIICDRIAKGESLRSICKDKDMPCADTVTKFLREKADQNEILQYARARDQQADRIAEEVIEIADDGSNDWMESNDPDNPGWKFNGEHAQRSRLRIDARKWFAGKVAPKKYGDRQIISGDDENPIAIQQNIFIGNVIAELPESLRLRVRGALIDAMEKQKQLTTIEQAEKNQRDTP